MADTAADTADTLTDLGYFGPDSVSWTLFSDPSSKLGGVAAILLQALNPMMMRLFDQTSGFATDMDGRAERTGRYIDTTIFGDKAHADAAGTSVRRMHAHARWTDPNTGEVLAADNPQWLAWTHNTFVYALVRASRQFGVPLTDAEVEQFVVEQLVAGRLIGIEDESLLPRTWADLETYIDAQTSWLALGVEAAEVTRGLRKPVLRGNPITVWTTVIVQDGVLSILPEWARLLYGIDGRPMNLRSAARTTAWLMSLARKSKHGATLIADATKRVQDHPYRRLRGENARTRAGVRH